MKKLIHYIFNNKHEKAVMIIMPILAIIISAFVLVPQIIKIRQISFVKNTTVDANINNVTAEPSEVILPSQSVSGNIISSSIVTPTTATNNNLIQVHLTAQSIEKDLYIFIRDNANNPVTGQVFKIKVKYPNGQVGTYETDTDGLCYLVNLTAGSYEISMYETAGYTIPDSIDVNVKETISYQKIENVEELVEIKEISEGLSEIKTNEEKVSDTETIIEYIQSESLNSNTEITTSSNDDYLYDSNGNKTYTYTYDTDSNGYLLYSDGTSTDIIPNTENGVLVCGFRYNAETMAYETVDLFNTDNTPKSDYKITAEPLKSTVQTVDGWQNENDSMTYYSNGEKVTGLKNIDGKLYYFDNNGERAQNVGIDVSFYNGNINWAAVKNAGIDFAIVRIGFRGWGSGAIYQDTCFSQNIKNAKAAGIKVGVYFYSTAVSKVEAVEEASICLEWLNNTSLDYPVFIDMEFSGDYPNGRQDSLSPAQRTEIALAFCETIKNGHYLPGIYSTQSFYHDEINFNSVSQFYVWLASFTENYALPDFNYRYDMWQFTDFGKVAGVNGSVDFNVIR